jgi:hypothetical protein
MILESVITCPHCATAKSETMPTDACQFFSTCTGCGATLRPKSGNCCVFCSYGSVPCPPISDRAFGRDGCPLLLCRIAMTANDIVQSSRDWLSSPRASALAGGFRKRPSLRVPSEGGHHAITSLDQQRAAYAEPFGANPPACKMIE